MTTERIVAVLDWFLMEGGEPLYESPPSAGDDVALDEGIYEIRFPDFEVYVGPSTRPALGILDVAALLRPAVALDADSIRAWLEADAARLPPQFEIEILPTDDGRDDHSIWLITRLSADDFVTDGLPDRLARLMTEARRLHHSSF
ncbi:MAG: hypothetical protein O3B66_09485 [Actinomycetota bacterium]|nr:hypothetical protein [Actinomycetota bacterium]MDA3025785.1 hypothetical protein [Actinomycetota bacterium]